MEGAPPASASDFWPGHDTWPCGPHCLCGESERQACGLTAAARQEAEGHDSLARRLLFSRLPAVKTAEVYGVRYAVFDDPGLGTLLVSHHGWPVLAALVPSAWYEGGRFYRQGERLGQSTGTVYRYGAAGVGGRPVELVVKVSRFAQEVPLYAGASFVQHIPPQVMASMRFNNPYEEFGRVERLRNSRRGPRVHTKAPLAIYSPPEHHALWQLGRDGVAASLERGAVEQWQDADHVHIDLDPHRAYFELFGWVKGIDVSTAGMRGLMSAPEMAQITHDVASDLKAHGMAVLDHKPAHIIVRRCDKTGGWLRDHSGRLAYVLVDYELLVDLHEVPAGA